MLLLETILPQNGVPLVDPIKLNSRLFANWPRTFDPDWFFCFTLRDPFFIEALSLFVNHDSGRFLTTFLLQITSQYISCEDL